MKVILTANEDVRTQRAYETINALFESAGASEISGTLGAMLQHYVHNAPAQRMDLANACDLVNRLTGFFFNLELLHRVQAGAPIKRGVLVEGKQLCTHN